VVLHVSATFSERLLTGPDFSTHPYFGSVFRSACGLWPVVRLIGQLCITAVLNTHPGRFVFVCGDQSGRTSAPISPHSVQTIREHSDRTGVSSGSQSAFMTAP